MTYLSIRLTRISHCEFQKSVDGLILLIQCMNFNTLTVNTLSVDTLPNDNLSGNNLFASTLNLHPNHCRPFLGPHQ